MEWQRANAIVQINDEPFYTQVLDEVTLTSGGSGESAFKIRESDFLWTAAVVVSTGSFRSRAFASWEDRYLDNSYVRSANFWGTAQKPLRHPPKFIPLNGQIVFSLVDTSSAPNTVAIYLVGKRARTCRNKSCADPRCCDRGRWGPGRGLYVLSTTKLSDGTGITLGANAGPTAGLPNMQTPDRYHTRFGLVTAEASGTGWKGTLERKEPGDERRRKISNAQMRAGAWTGSSTDPFILPSPITSEKHNTVEAQLTDVSGAGITGLHMALIGETLDDELLRLNA